MRGHVVYETIVASQMRTVYGDHKRSLILIFQLMGNILQVMGVGETKMGIIGLQEE